MLTAALIINIIIILCEVVTLFHIKNKRDILKYYTYLQNFIALVVSLIFSVYAIGHLTSDAVIPEFVKGLRYIATCGLVATTAIFVIFLGAGKKAPMTNEDFLNGYSPKVANMILHYICPILSVVSFVLFEREIALSNGIWTALVAIPSCGYWIIYAILSAAKLWEPPYDFATQDKHSKIGDTLTMILIPLTFILISFLVWNVSALHEMTPEPEGPHIQTIGPMMEIAPSEPVKNTTPIEFAPDVTEPVEPELTTPIEEEPIPTEPKPEPKDEDFVLVKEYIPDIVVDLRYATDNNFTGQVIYDFTDAYLRYGTVKKLMLVQDELRQQGLYIKIWDGFRPPYAQFRLWEVCPNPTYVANPTNGFSSHSRGNTVDITLVDENGVELEMPTEFDDFSKKADRNYNDCSKEAAKNAKLLEDIMKKHGFKPYSSEWWHFSDKQSYDVGKDFKPNNPKT